MNEKKWYEYADERQRFTLLHQQLVTNGKLLYAGKLLHRAARLFGNSIALIYQDQKITFKRLYERAMQFTLFLKKQGLKPGARVLICFENCPEFYIAYFGIWQAGAVVAPLNTFLKEHELKHIVKDAQPQFIVTSSSRVAEFKAIVGDSIKIFTPEDMPDQAMSDVFAHDHEIVEQESDVMAALLYTSGTTGLPKGVMLSSSNIIFNLIQGAARIATPGKERALAVLPLFHVFAQNACIWAPIFMDSTIVLVPKIDRRYILEGLKHQPTVFLGIPALYGLLCLMKTAPLDSVRYFISGGDAMPDRIRSYFSLIYRRKICSGYGLTETSPLISLDLDDDLALTNAVGKPVVGVHCQVRDDHGKELLQGEIGSLWVKGPNVMLGYYNEPEKTAETLIDGWFNTGDLGYISKEGAIIITGRLKDLIIHKGFNIYPQEVENVLLSHSSIFRAGVVGKKDPMVGEYAIAFVYTRSNYEPLERELFALCENKLASYKVPKEIRIVDQDLPLTSTGKVDKKELKKLLEKE